MILVMSQQSFRLQVKHIIQSYLKDVSKRILKKKKSKIYPHIQNSKKKELVSIHQNKKTCQIQVPKQIIVEKRTMLIIPIVDVQCTYHSFIVRIYSFSPTTQTSF